MIYAYTRLRYEVSVYRTIGRLVMKQGFKVSQVIEILNKSKNWVMKWSVLGETGEFSEEVFTESHFNISVSTDDMKRRHYCLMMSS